MAEIKTSMIINSTQEKIWNIISDIDNEPKFWKGTKKVRNISKEGNSVSREITIAFRDQKCLQEVTITPKEMIQAVFTEGVIVGEKIITLKNNGDSCELEVVWNVKLSGMMGMFTGMIKKHIKSGTEQALQAIKKELENKWQIS
jgi:ribosome-associated toxin RatA of RatAB toxin-antitoxin module